MMRPSIQLAAAALTCSASALACEATPHAKAGNLGLEVMMASSVDKPAVAWKAPIASSETPPKRLVVVGTRKDGAFHPTSVYIPDSVRDRQPPPPAPFRLMANLLPSLDLRTFGAEERVSASSQGDVLTIGCRAGNQPAGAVLSNPAMRYPLGMSGELRIEGQSVGEFSFAMTMPGSDAPEGSPRDFRGEFGTLAAIPSSAWQGGERALVILCPRRAATATLKDIRILPDSAARPVSRGTWIWDIRPWLNDPEALVARARAHAISTIFLQLHIKDGRIDDDARTQRLIETLSAGGVAVHPVEGDAEMATPHGLPNALARARTIHAFMAKGSPLRAVQYDIEPYLRPDHTVDPRSSWNEWASAVEQLSSILDGAVSVVVPFWMMEDENGAAALERVAGKVTAIAVMAYRTDLTEVERIAEGWLSWGQAHRLPVAIALENGPIEAEYHRTYVRAERGKLVLDRSTAPQTVNLLDVYRSSSLAKPVYSFTHEVFVNPARISFLDNRPDLDKAVTDLGRILGSWSSIDLLLVHELLPWGGRGEPDVWGPE